MTSDPTLDSSLKRRTEEFGAEVSSSPSYEELQAIMLSRLDPDESVYWWARPDLKTMVQTEGAQPWVLLSATLFLFFLMTAAYALLSRPLGLPTGYVPGIAMFAISVAIVLFYNSKFSGYISKCSANTIFAVTSKRAIRMYASKSSLKSGQWIRFTESFVPEDISLAAKYQVFAEGHVYKLPFFYAARNEMNRVQTSHYWTGFESLKDPEGALAALRKLRSDPNAAGQTLRIGAEVPAVDVQGVNVPIKTVNKIPSQPRANLDNVVPCTNLEQQTFDPS